MKVKATYSVSGMTLWGLTLMASALWVMRRCHLVCRQKIYVTGTLNRRGGNAVRRLTSSGPRRWAPSARRSGLRFRTWKGRRRTCCLAGGRETLQVKQAGVRKQRRAARRGPTCGHGAHQYSVELDDGAEGVLGFRGARQVFAVALQDETLVLPLQQDQDVLQEQRVQF